MNFHTERECRHARLGILFTMLALASAGISTAAWSEEFALAPPKASPLDMVNALHAAFGEHHARAVHTKGVMLEGTFTPSKEAVLLTKASVFRGGELPIETRFSLFAGVPDLPDTNDGASPAGFAIKIKEKDGNEFDVECNQHNSFIVATVDEFREFLLALAASGAGVPRPTPLEKFLSRHPESREFLASRTYPASFASAAYFGVNSVELANNAGKKTFARYRLVPRTGERYLNADERKAQTADYLQSEIAQRVASGPIVYDWYAQIAENGDEIENPAIAWPESRKLIKLGTFTMTKLPDDPEAAQKTLLFLPGQPHPGVAPADPMLVLRNNAYPISLGQRQ